MTCAWIFCLLALCSLPAVLSAFSVFSGVFPTFLIKASVIALIAWIAQTFIQLVALSIIIVGQNIQAEASDARAAKTFEDAEETKSNVLLAIDRLDTETQGGLQVILEAIKKKK